MTKSTKQTRGKVRHAVFDPDNQMHINAADKLKLDKPNKKEIKEGHNLILQFYKGEPSGHIEYTIEPHRKTKKPNAVFIHDILLKKKFRDTKQTKEEYFNNELFQKIMDKVRKNTHFYRDERLTKRGERERKKAWRTALNLVPRKDRLYLAAKLTKFLANKFKVPLTTTHARSPMGEKVMKRYYNQYSYGLIEDYLSRKGRHKTRKGKINPKAMAKRRRK